MKYHVLRWVGFFSPIVGALGALERSVSMVVSESYVCVLQTVSPPFRWLVSQYIVFFLKK